MPIPQFVQASAGFAVTAGTSTVSMTGCTAGNLVFIDIVCRATGTDFTYDNFVNLDSVEGTPNSYNGIKEADVGTSMHHRLLMAKVGVDGTCSFDLGRDTADVYCRMYEFSTYTPANRVSYIIENGLDNILDTSGLASATVEDCGVTTNGIDRLAINFVAIPANQALGDFTGETGGDWTEAVAEYATSTGAAATLQIQTSSMAAAGIIDGGTLAIAAADWSVFGTALIYPPPVMPSGWSTRILDTFNRPDGPVGTNWTAAVTGYTVPNIQLGELAWPEFFPAALWTTPYGRNQQAFIKVAVGSAVVGFLLRWANPNTGNESGYIVYGSTSSADLYFAEAKVWTAGIASEVSLGFENFVVDATDKFLGAQIVGSLIELYGSPDGITWTLRKTWTDSTFDRGGYIGLFDVNQDSGSTPFLDFFGGGTILDAPTFPTPRIRARRTSW